MMLRPATFVIKVYRAEDLPRSRLFKNNHFSIFFTISNKKIKLKVDSTFFQGVKSIFSAKDQKKEFIDPYVVFSFAGKKVYEIFTISRTYLEKEV